MLHYNRCGIAALGLIIAFSSSIVCAHPHSFIDMQTSLVHQGDELTGLKMRWVMDEITSADLLYDAGTAKADSVVWKKLAAEVMANVLGQHYFTEFWHQKQPVKFENLPPEYHLSRQGHQAVLEFILPLAHPQALKGQRYTFSTFDPTYFVDMYYDSEKALIVPAELAAQCHFELYTPKPDASMQAYALSLDKADAPAEEMDLGRQFAQTVTLICQ
ncbi:DUF1007 family protein [Erwinia sorbitola]|uniref:DUF1007 family protein n=1 Tax=Erwinia sorbitola TaxID=2681984 RepID=A0A6I6ER24_9GAMM|nr:DUF1007 family protein [Erwinia sorbitola]MTD28533.1 DUF1007 family protein [Erwinia sorbitola]QGU86643.1 DUF1007 family protein [Erwinia sorbitola]